MITFIEKFILKRQSMIILAVKRPDFGNSFFFRFGRYPGNDVLVVFAEAYKQRANIFIQGFVMKVPGYTDYSFWGAPKFHDRSNWVFQPHLAYRGLIKNYRVAISRNSWCEHPPLCHLQ